MVTEKARTNNVRSWKKLQLLLLVTSLCLPEKHGKGQYAKRSWNLFSKLAIFEDAIQRIQGVSICYRCSDSVDPPKSLAK